MTRAQPLVSIVVNNYNYARFLGEAIRSALAQTYTPLEVVVVDDGSTDRSREVIEGFADRIVPVLKPNGGQGSALNAGFAAARGEVVIFLDADDVLLPGATGEAVAALREPGTVKVHWPLREINEHGGRTGRLLPAEPLPAGDLRDFTLRQGPSTSVSAPTSGNAWTRSFLARVMPIPESAHRISADAYLFGLAPAFGVIARLDEPQGSYRVHGNNHYRGKSFEERLQTGLGNRREQWRVLEEHCRRSGIGVDRSGWERRSYFHRLDTAIHEIEELVPAGSPFILADEDRWGCDHTVAGRRRIPFLECNGWYNGRPVDDAAAIRELERLRSERGASHLAIAWPAFWWLDHYTGFAAHLRENFPCVIANDRLVAYDLRFRPLPTRRRHRLVFVGGLHKSGTSLLARCLAEHTLISGFRETGVPEDEGQHLQTVFPSAGAHGGPGRFGFDPQAHLTEASALASEENRSRLLAEWGRHWDLSKPVLLEKSPPNLIRTRFLQALFPEACFVVVTRHPIPVALATQKWSRTGIESLIEHWLLCHQLFEQDRPHLRRLYMVRYEDFVERPQPVLDELFAFLELPMQRSRVPVRPDSNATYLQGWGASADGALPHPACDALRIARLYGRRIEAFGYRVDTGEGEDPSCRDRPAPASSSPSGP